MLQVNPRQVGYKLSKLLHPNINIFSNIFALFSEFGGQIKNCSETEGAIANRLSYQNIDNSTIPIKINLVWGYK